MKSTNERIKKLKDLEHSLSEKIKVAQYEIDELQEYVSNLRYKQNKAQGRLFKLMFKGLQENLKNPKTYEKDIDDQLHDAFTEGFQQAIMQGSTYENPTGDGYYTHEGIDRRTGKFDSNFLIKS